MRDYRKDLRWLAIEEYKTLQQLDRFSRSGTSSPFEDEKRQELEASLKKDRERFERAVDEMLRYPPQHIRHFAKLEEFWKAGGYDESIFIMTKFPDSRSPSPLDDELMAVLKALRDELQRLGFKPRLASDQTYHPALWDNVELHLVGCKQAVAVVEDVYKPELNPNVAMEWGWMRGMGKTVYYLVEENFRHERADWIGLLSEKFSWKEPEKTIRAALKSWEPTLKRRP